MITITVISGKAYDYTGMQGLNTNNLKDKKKQFEEVLSDPYSECLGPELS